MTKEKILNGKAIAATQAALHKILLDKKYVIVEKTKEGICTLQTVYDGIKHDVKSVKESVENIRMYMEYYNFKVLNATLSSDNRLIVKKMHFPPIIVAYMYALFFNTGGFRKNDLMWLCELVYPYDGLFKNNLEILLFDQFFYNDMKKEYVDMLNMSKYNPQQFVQYAYEDLKKLSV